MDANSLSARLTVVHNVLLVKGLYHPGVEEINTGPGPGWEPGLVIVAGPDKDAADQRVSHASKSVKRCNTIAWDVPTRSFMFR